MHEMIETAKALGNASATALLAMACIVLGLVVRALYERINKLNETIAKLNEEHGKAVNAIQEARIDDIQAYTTRAEAHFEKGYKLADDLGKAIDVVVKDSRRSR